MEVNSATTTILSGVTFREAIWLFPPAFTLHVLEEWPRFTNWAQRHASPLFTQRDYNNIQIAGIIASFLFTLIVWSFPNRAVVFVFFAFIFAPSLFFNTLFHAAGTQECTSVREVGYGLSLEGASAADLVKLMHASSEKQPQTV